jgi:hypothetical protein
MPVIRILLKRSVKGGQVLDMNSSDFQRAAGGRKVKFTFSFTLYKGRLQNAGPISPLGADLIYVLQNDEIAGPFVKANQLDFSINKNFQLSIKNSTPVIEKSEPAEEENKMVDETTAGLANE